MGQERDAAEPKAPPVLAAADFTPLAGTPVRFAGRDIELVLAAVEEQAEGPRSGGGRRPFTLVLRGRAGRHPRGEDLLPEGLHRCLFADGAAHDIHVAPVHTLDPSRQDYQAVFN